MTFTAAHLRECVARRRRPAPQADESWVEQMARIASQPIVVRYDDDDDGIQREIEFYGYLHGELPWTSVNGSLRAENRYWSEYGARRVEAERETQRKSNRRRLDFTQAETQRDAYRTHAIRGRVSVKPEPVTLQRDYIPVAERSLAERQSIVDEMLEATFGPQYALRIQPATLDRMRRMMLARLSS